MKTKLENLPSSYNNDGIPCKMDIPINIRELKILNLAQQSKQILKAIDPEKLIHLATIDGKQVLIYREFYYYLKEANVTTDKNILGILERIYSSNLELPVNIKDIDSLMDYISEDKKDAIKALNKNFGRPLKVMQNVDIKKFDPLTKAKYIALEFRGKSKVMIYGENSCNVYNVNLLNKYVVKYLNRILNRSDVKIIVKEIETHNILIQNKLVARNLIPMDICSLPNNKNNANFESLLNDFVNHEEEVDTKMLAFINFSRNTEFKIKVEDLKNGFYRLKAIETNDDNSIVIVINTKLTLDSVQNVKISHKDFYYNLACFVNKFTRDTKYAEKVKYNILEIGDELILSTNQTNKKYVIEIMSLAFKKNNTFIISRRFSYDQLQL